MKRLILSLFLVILLSTGLWADPIAGGGGIYGYSKTMSLDTLTVTGAVTLSGLTASRPLSLTSGGVVETLTIANFNTLIGMGAGNSPSFTGLTLSGLNASRPLSLSAANVVETLTAANFNTLIGLGASNTVSFSTVNAALNGTLGLTTAAAANITTISATSGTLAGLTGLGIRDTSAAYDVTLVMTSSSALTGAKNMTFNMGNANQSFIFTGASNITFPTGNKTLLDTTGAANSLAAQYIDWNSSSGGNSIANKPTLGTISSQAASNVAITGGLITGTVVNMPILNKTTSYTITTADLGSTIRMNSSGAANFNLPSVAAGNDGARVTLIKLGAGNLSIIAADSDKIADSIAGGSINNNIATQTWATITLEYCDTTVTWVVIGAHGTWNTI